MKKFIPYILIAVMISTFLWVSFVKPNIVSAQAQEKGSIFASGWQWIKDQFGTKALVAYGKNAYSDPSILIPGVAVGYKIADTIGWGDWGKVADATFGRMLSWISNFTWYASAKIFTVSGYLLDYAVDFSVKDFKKNIEMIRVIDIGYEIILSIANMIFIFLLLYIAIKTILGMGGDMKKLLTNIIVVGLLINFSLFMTKAMIDASNIVAMGFYNIIRTEMGRTQIEGNSAQTAMISIGSVSTAMMAGLKLQTQMIPRESDYIIEDPSKGFSHLNMAMNQFAGSALFLVSAFAFFAVAFLFIIRFIALLFYMLFSPVAFLGYISPELKEHSSKWWKGLQNQLIFAPAFLFIAYLISAIVNSGQLWKAVGGDQDTSSTFFDFISKGNGQGFPIIMNYVILTALMIGGLITAKTMAAQGSAGMVGYADKFRGWMQGVGKGTGRALGRNTIGRGAYLAGNSDYMAKMIDKRPMMGALFKKQLDNVADMKFGGKTSFTGAVKKSTEEKKKIRDFLANKKVGNKDELIWKEEDIKEEKLEAREVIQQRLKKPLEEENKLEKTLSKTDEEIKKLNDTLKKSSEEYNNLKGVALSAEGTTGEAAAKTAADAARQKMESDDALLKSAQKNKTGDELKLQNIRNVMAADKTALENLTKDIKQSQDKIDLWTMQKKHIQSNLKRNYVGSLPFRSWGAGFGFLDKIFPSYVKATEELRKGQTQTLKDLEKMLEKMADEKVKQSGGSGAGGTTTP